MKTTEIEGIFKKEKRLFTENPSSCIGIKVYNEQLVPYENKEFRSWNPYRSKLAAAILKGLKNISQSVLPKLARSQSFMVTGLTF